MLSDNVSDMWLMLVLLIVNRAAAVSYNQPKFCQNVSWYPNATIFPDNSTIDLHAFSIFVNINNTVYVSSQFLQQIEMWFEGDVSPTRIMFTNLSNPFGIFVTDTGDIYADQGNNYRVDKRTMNANDSVTVMHVSRFCTGLFVDINNTLYCSMYAIHQVVAKSLYDATNTTTVVAGDSNGTSGSTPIMLSAPHGIFVDINFRLYVADCSNNRVQRFEWGQLNGTTVAGNGTSGAVLLNCPTGVVLDADSYLFIADRGGKRIVGSGPSGFRCIVGCSEANSTPSNTLPYPETLSFDSYGNMYVTGRNNLGIKKFILAANSCDDSSTSQPPKISTINTEESTTTIHSTYPSTTVLIKPSTSPFVPLTCSDPTHIGSHCDISVVPCDLLEPCQNNATCNNINTGYICICLPGFNGTECQFDYRPCKPNTCWNNGTCKEVTDTTFNCTCASNWTGIHCEIKINYCENVICQNKGVCRPLLGDYKCECLGDSFSGRHCEITTTQTLVRQAFSKAFAFIAILAGVSVMAFFVVMDILKYCFGIDPTYNELERIRRKKRAKKPKNPVIIRYIYSNALPTPE